MEPVRLQPSSPPTVECQECWDGGGGYDSWTRTTKWCDCPAGVEAKQRHRDGEILEWIAESNIPLRLIRATLADFPATPESSSAVDAARNWLQGSEEGHGLFIHGEYGVGKTGIASALLLECIQGHARGYFVAVPDLMDSIRASYGDHSTEADRTLLQKVKEVPYLVLDDIGAERPSEWVVEKLFTIINRRHSEMLTTFFTSNLSIAQLAERLGERITWRIVEMCDVVHLKGPNLRAKS